MSGIFKKSFTVLLIILLSVSVFGSTRGIAEEDVNETNDEEKSTNESVPSDLNSGVQTSVSAGVSIEDENNYLKNMALMTENEHLELYIHKTTTEIAVREKASGKIWFSNPIDRESDTVASAENKGMLSSQLTVTYFSKNGQSNRMHNFTESTSKGQFEFEEVENGVKVIYTLGDNSLGIEAIPKRISKERFFSEIIDKIEGDKEKKDMEKRFLYIEEEEVYERREAVFSKVILSKTLKIFEEIGYTEEDLAIDNAENTSESAEDNGKPKFTIPVQYQLDGESLLVTVEGKEIQQKEAYPISSIDVLQFFGAAGGNKDGYIFVPDGSGAIIELNNGKSNYDPFLGQVYGTDEAKFAREEVRVNQAIRLPVFGMKQDNHAFFSIIEKGDAIASIGADVAGRINSYNTVYSNFNIIESGELSLSGGERSSSVTVYQKERYQDDLVIRYGFLQDEEASYTGMAHFYQDYLVNKHGLQALEENEDVPFYLELIGSVWKRNTFLGVPYKSLEPLTTFDEAKEIVGELKDENVKNIKLRYTGWFNEGVAHSIPTNIKIDREIGGEKGFNEFKTYLSENDINLYPDVSFMKVYRDTLGFSPNKDASRFITRKIATIYPYNPASFLRDTEKSPYHVLSPAVLPSYVDKFTNDYQDFELSGVSLRDLGSSLNSDYREKKVINREDAKEVVSEQFATIASEFPDILIEGGNSVALPYSKNIVNMSLSSSDYNITDESVPFYQMVIHGYIDYAGKPMNISDNQDIQYNLLKALETGSNVHFQWFYEDPSTVKDTEFNYLYSSNYQQWMSHAVEAYEEVNNVLKDVRTQPITSHQKLAEGVYQTTYGNGYSVIVNYNNSDVQVNGIRIESKGYTIRQGE